MTSEYLVDPELRNLLSFLPPMDLNSESLPGIRAAIEQTLAALPQPVDPRAATRVADVAGPANSPRVRVFCYRPLASTGPLPAILHIHGGGYILGSPAMSESANRALAVDLGCAVFSVDYRLAPETPYPGPVEDCFAALAWLRANAAELQIDPARIGVKGESAGGGLAAALALLARDRGVPLAFQHLIYPMLDDRTSAADSTGKHAFVGEYVWTHAQNRFGWSALLGAAPGAAAVSPYAAPARASDLSGLPPAFVSVGALDLFLEEDLEYARRLTRAGVPVELHVYPGAFHAFDMPPHTARVAQNAARDSQDALRRALHGR